MIRTFKKILGSSVAASCLLTAQPALAAVAESGTLYTEIFNILLALFAGAALGHLINKVRNLKFHERELIESNRISEALSQSINTVIHANNEIKMTQELCDTICSLNFFKICWVSILPDEGTLGETLSLDVTSGFELGGLTYKPTETLKQCYSSGECVVLIGSECHAAFPALSDTFDHLNIQSCGIYPLCTDGKIMGFLGVASDTENCFGHRRNKVLLELANDIAHGLARLRGQRKRMQAEEALRESESHYRSLVEMSPDAILVLDERDEIVFANKRGYDLFAPGETDEILGTFFTNYIAESDIEIQNIALFEKNIPIKTYSSVSLRRLDATRFDADIVSNYVIQEGKQIRLLIIRDVTERNRVNEHLAQSSKLATLGEMAAGITHELSQPLNIIRFAAEGTTLKMKRGTVDHDEIYRQFDLIALQCGRMADIIDHMRVFSRKDTGSKEVFDPAIVIRQAVDMVEAQYYAEDIHFEVRYPPYYQKVNGRQIQLEQVLLNLITNARDAINTREKNMGGDLGDLKKIDVTMTYDQGDDLIKVSVSDNGGGIPKDALEKLFDPFFTTKEVGKGTGLGLSVSYGIIAAMGGKIQARNIHNGARFDITLPALKTEMDLPPKALERKPYQPVAIKAPRVPIEIDEMEDDDDMPDFDMEHEGPCILVVDDEVYAAEAITEFLFGEGYCVNIAGNGEEALDLFDAEEINLVITDVRMPKMDGFELSKKLKERNPDLPIIVVTGHTGLEEDSAVNLDALAYSVLKKPVSLEELGTLVKQAIEKT